MTKEQLAEREYPPLMSNGFGAKPIDLHLDQRAAFINGLELAVEVAEWIHKNPNIIIQKDGYWYNPGVDLSYKELVELYLTEKYGSNEQKNK